ncbi:STAS/SEC14 domain-containing protein [Halomonas salinarum]|uniref:STAS/SEC14 domain-containing protein n=1 Tax=Halomonas salinarum TaxID=1158993 RepID=UPI001439AB3C|nr:STAS/SEC14 domain-containing protein [Halomonas salinarum]
MIELLPSEASHVVALRASGRVSADDLQEAIDAIEALKKTHERVSLYAEIDEMRWMTLSAIMRDLGYGLTQIGDLEHYHRAALVTDHDWLRPLVSIENQLFKPLEVRVFDTHHKDEAKEWVRQLPTAPENASADNADAG